MKFRDLKIGQKIITGFAAIAGIALIVGVIGLIGLRNVGYYFNDVAKEKMPAVVHLKEVEAGIENLMVAMRTLLNPNLTSQERANQIKAVREAREYYNNALVEFEKFPLDKEEEVLYSRFKAAVVEWRKANEAFEADVEKLDRLDIHYPMEFLKDLERFEKDHYALQVRMANAIQTGAVFDGGDDHTACNLGRWIPNLKTTNSVVNTGIANMREHHNRFHRSVHDAMEQLRRGNRGTAQNIYMQQMLPAANEVFKYFEILNEQATQAVELFAQMEELQMIEALKHLEVLQASLKGLVELNIKVANDEVEMGSTVITASNIMMILAILIGLAIAVFLSLFISRIITNGINKGVALAETVAAGDLTIEVDDELLEQKDEIGHLARSLQQMVEQLRDIIGDVIAGAENITSASQEMSGTSQQMSQGASEQASSAEEISSSMEEMVANIQQNTDNALQTEKIAIQAVEGIRKGSDSTDIAVKSMKEIASKVSIIGDIAFQTNMLALNAAVEAARAGEHGKGFAVVAEEVRKLAERSQIAAEEIDILSVNGVQIAEQASKQLSEIVPEIERTAKLVQEIAAASMEQNSGADQVNNAIQQLNQVIQQNAAASEEMASSSEELSSQAEQMKDVVSYFTIENDIRMVKGKTKKGKKPVVITKKTTTKVQTTREKLDGKGVDFKLNEVSDDDFQRY